MLSLLMSGSVSRIIIDGKAKVLFGYKSTSLTLKVVEFMATSNFICELYRWFFKT